MKKLMLIAGLVVAGVAAIAYAAPGDARLMSLQNFNLRLNGKPVKKGTIAVSSTVITNATTSTPFTLTGGSVLQVDCDAAGVYVAVGSSGCTVSATITSADYRPQIVNAHDKLYIITESTDTCIAVVGGGGAVNCAVFDMQ